MPYKRILITGANGLVGQELVRLLGRFREYDVLATAREPVSRLEESSFGYAPLDVTSAGDVQHVFQDFLPSVVINCAAMTRVDSCETNREACWKVNVEAVETLARQCRRAGAHLIQLSTDFVFNGLQGPYHEGARPDPVNFYGKSKLASENAAHGAGLYKWSIVRTCLVYGRGSRLARINFALHVIDRLSAGEPMQVVTDQWRTTTWAPDLAAGIERMVRRNASGVFHLSGNELMSIYEFVSAIAEVFHLDKTLIEPVDSGCFRQTATRPARTGLITLKAETGLGYRPRTTVQALRGLRARLGNETS